MLSKVYGCGLFGVDGLVVTVETDVAPGLPGYAVVGLPDAGIKESKERVYSALKNSGYRYPAKHITINLAPADLKKEGAAFDLPIAIGLMIAFEYLPENAGENMMIVGELSLGGEIKGIPGILPMTLAAKKQGLKSIIVPKENRVEAAIVDGIDVLPAAHLNEVVQHLSGEVLIKPYRRDIRDLLQRSDSEHPPIDMSDIRGQDHAKRALIIAAAGGHNLLMTGPPGSGKSMLAKAFPTILPDLTPDEALEITKIYSIAGLLKEGEIISRRPFRSPHHTISNVGLIGGGRIPKPGEVSLAHLGVLYLDELPEFSKVALETLRQPIEDRRVTIARVNATLTYPASFMLITSQNPCPCGYYGSPKHKCTCSESEIRRYQNKISGPLLDRIDLKIEVPATEIEDLQKRKKGRTSREIRQEVNAARDIQNVRYADFPNVFFNSQLTPAMIEDFCPLDEPCQKFIKQVFEKLNLSARGYHRIIKLARTIADLQGAEQIQKTHLSEAVQYRTM